MEMLGCVITHCPWAGTDSVETLELKWLIHVSTRVIVVRIGLADLTEHTLQWLMGLFNAKCVSMIMDVAVIIQLTSVSDTVGRSTFIILTDSMSVTYVTVATNLSLHHQVGEFSYISLAHYSIELFFKNHCLKPYKYFTCNFP